MNTSEGINRIAKVVRWIGNGVAGLAVLGCIGVAATDGSDKASGIGMLLFLAAIAYGCGRAISWILEGFAKPRDNR